MIAESMGKDGLLYFLLSCIAPFAPQTMLRMELRERHNIDGSLLEDLVLGCCCTGCVSCQIANEVEARGAGA